MGWYLYIDQSNMGYSMDIHIPGISHIFNWYTIINIEGLKNPSYSVTVCSIFFPSAGSRQASQKTLFNDKKAKVGIPKRATTQQLTPRVFAKKVNFNEGKLRYHILDRLCFTSRQFTDVARYVVSSGLMSQFSLNAKKISKGGVAQAGRLFIDFMCACDEEVPTDRQAQRSPIK